MARESTVFIVEYDPDIHEVLASLLEAEGFKVAMFATGTEFLESIRPIPHGCIVLDIDLPDFSGLDIQRILHERGIDPPIVFLTGTGDVPKARAGFRGGAVDFLEKPVDADVLIGAVRRGLDLAVGHAGEKARDNKCEASYSHLTPREKEVLALLARGYATKRVGRALGISHRTTEIHRGHILEKLGAKSIADLVDLAIHLGIR